MIRLRPHQPSILAALESIISENVATARCKRPEVMMQYRPEWKRNERHHKFGFDSLTDLNRKISAIMNRRSPRWLTRRGLVHHSLSSKYEPPCLARSGGSWGTGYNSQRR